MGKILIGVDVGRENVKVFGDHGYNSVYPTVAANFSRSSFVNNAEDAPKDKYSYRFDDNRERLVFGKDVLDYFCDGDIIAVSEDEEFLRLSAFHILKECFEACEDGDDIELGTCFTYANKSLAKNILGSSIPGKHTVTMYDFAGNVVSVKSFTITRMVPFFQGASGFYDYVTDEAGFILPNSTVVKDNVLTVDFGGHTIDLNHIRNCNLVPIKQATITHGVGFAFREVSKILQTQYHYSMNARVVSERIISGRHIVPDPKNGTSIDLQEIASRCILESGTRIKNDIEDFRAGESFQHVIAMGGAVGLYKELLRSLYAGVVFVDGTMMANARGMWKYLNAERITVGRAYAKSHALSDNGK